MSEIERARRIAVDYKNTKTQKFEGSTLESIIELIIRAHVRDERGKLKHNPELSMNYERKLTSLLRKPLTVNISIHSRIKLLRDKVSIVYITNFSYTHLSN